MDDRQKLKSAFDQIHAEESIKTQTKKYLFEKVYHKEKKHLSPLPKFAAAGACCLLLFIIGGSYQMCIRDRVLPLYSSHDMSPLTRHPSLFLILYSLSS